MLKTIAATSVLALALVIAAPQAETADEKPAVTDAVEQPAVAQARRSRPRMTPQERARRRPMSPKLVEQCFQVAREVDPALAERLEGLRRTQGEEAFQRSIRRARHLIGLARLKERNPQLYDVKVEELQVDARVNHTLEAIRDARRSGTEAVAEIARLEKELHQLVREQVSLSIASRGMYLRTLQDHVKAMRDRLTEQADNFDSTVEQRYRKLLDELEAEIEMSAEPDTG